MKSAIQIKKKSIIVINNNFVAFVMKHSMRFLCRQPLLMLLGLMTVLLQHKVDTLIKRMQVFLGFFLYSWPDTL